PIIGLVLAGVVVATGTDIKRFKVGDQVYGLTGFGLGAYAAYKCMRETDSVFGCLAHKPNLVSYEEATMLAYGGLLAFRYMERGQIKAGHQVLIYGASGTTGTIAIQLAKYLGAKVTAVCSTSNVELVKSLGADTVIDYTKEDTLAPGTSYDFILDAVGKMKISKLKYACKKALAPGGKYVSIDDGRLLLDAKRLDQVSTLVDAGHVKPVMDRSFSFDEIIEAHSYVEQGHKKGGVAVRID
ncbi:MAG TPA: NAD(P)-dependent alcohol dehydrogenase, partial [Cytophagales bacterium]|nr:NAD(P)-dependent alcohol dehydrogenase [Cytophagales bacterium]